jgi:manganese transport protein
MSVVNEEAGIGKRLKAWFFSLGPGIITAALVFGPSKITITSKLGADYGYSLLWIVAVAIFFMIIFTSMAARIGMATQLSLLTSVRQKWGSSASVGVGIGIFLVTTSFQAGNAIGIGIALAEMFHTATAPWIILFNLIGIGLLFFRAFYKVLERIMIALVTVMLIAFLTTLFLVKPAISEVTAGLVPSVPHGASGLVIAFIASCFSIVGAFYQTYLVQERKRLNPDARLTNNSLTGILILGLMSAIVLICAATVLHPRGVHVNSATDMARALEPLFGKYASVLFLCGLFGASFSALIGNASVGGTLLGDALGYGSQLNTKAVRYFIALIMVIGASIAIIFGKLPLQLIIFAQSITVLVVPFIGLAMYAIANDRNIMGIYKNNISTKIMGAVGLLLITGLALESLRALIIK